MSVGRLGVPYRPVPPPWARAQGAGTLLVRSKRSARLAKQQQNNIYIYIYMYIRIFMYIYQKVICMRCGIMVVASLSSPAACHSSGLHRCRSCCRHQLLSFLPSSCHRVISCCMLPRVTCNVSRHLRRQRCKRLARQRHSSRSPDPRVSAEFASSSESERAAFEIATSARRLSQMMICL